MDPTRRYLRVAGASLVLALAPAAPPAPQSFPERLERYLTDTVKLGAAERRQLAAGTPVTKILPGDASKEIGVFGAVWINAPIDRYVAMVHDIARFETGRGFNVTKKISTPPVIGDFGALRLPAEDARELRDCRVGDCAVKLDADAIERLRTRVNWRAPNHHAVADGLMRELALEYTTRYLERGNAGLPVYRDKAHPTDVRREFEAMVNGMPEMTIYLPNLRRYLFEFPHAELPGGTSFLYWQETQFGLKPTIRISHVAIRQTADETVVASKMIYATHYFLAGLELRVLMPDPARGAGFWLITVNRSRTDGLTGITGIFVRRRLRSDVQKATLTILTSTKRRLE